MIAPVAIEAADDAFALGEREGVAVLVWRGRPTRRRLERSVEGFAEIVRRCSPARVSMLAVIEERSAPPGLADMRFSAGAFDRFAHVLAASVAVLEERNGTLLVLDALARVNALRRRPTPTKFCADVHEAATWLASRHPHSHSTLTFRASVVSTVEHVRAEIG